MINIRQWGKSTVGMGLWRPWLTDRGSLTQRLQSRCPSTFRVLRLSQKVGKPMRDETRLLGLIYPQRALIREVLLLSGDTPLIFAHTVIPLDGLRGPWQALAGLGNQSLGATLFANPRIERFPLEYRRLNLDHPMQRSATKHLGREVERLWARRSLFALDHCTIMVSEVFLPAVLDLPAGPSKLEDSGR